MRVQTLTKLVNIPYRLIAMEQTNISSVLDTFREFATTQGQPVYLWKAERGLYRQDIPHIKIPNTNTPSLLLDYIKKNRKQGVFVLLNFEAVLQNTFMEYALLDTVKQMRQSNTIFLLSEKIDLSRRFLQVAIETKHLWKMKLQRAA